MKTDRFVGTTAVRVCTLGAALACAALGAQVREGSALVLGAAIGSGILTWIGVVHSFAPVFRWWIRFADRLNVAVVTFLFGACYVLIVPLFLVIVRPRDPLRLRRARSRESSWVPCRRTVDLQSLERMG